jgi:2-polyprenyl-3-methyl-5-hydroxy-6-metoxy-1,4-benzoquinol methylase
MNLKAEWPICKKVSHLLIAEISDDRYNYPGSFSIYRCENCDHCFTLPRFQANRISELYQDFYGRNQLDINEIKSQALENIKRGNSKYLKKRFQMEINLLKIEKPRQLKLLDFGSGSCLELSELNTLHFKVWGHETDPNSHRIAKDLDYNMIQTEDDLYDFVNFFDYIQLNQVLEHFIQPDSKIKEITKLLKIDGILHIETPNADSIYRKILKSKWINWHVPFHQHHFSIKSIENILHKNGYTILYLETKTPYQWTLTQVAVILNDIFTNHAPKIWDKEDKKPLSKSKQFLKVEFILKIMRLIINMLNYFIDKTKNGDSIVITARRIK